MHPYNMIMGIHYANTLDQDRPKIFGITASPTASSDSSYNSIKELERNMNAHAISTISHKSLIEYVSRPTERIVYYVDFDFFAPPQLYCRLMMLRPGLLGRVDREIKDCLLLSDTLGPWAAERALELAIIDICAGIKKKLLPSKKNNGGVVVGHDKNYHMDYSIGNEGEMIDDVDGQDISKYSGDTNKDGGDANKDSGLMNKDGALKNKDGGLTNGDVGKFSDTHALNKNTRNKRKFVEDGDGNDGEVDEEVLNYTDFKSSKYEFDPFEGMSVDELQELDQFMKSCQNYEFWGSRARAPTENELGAKVKCLIDLLLEYKDEHEFFCGIIFCQQRVMAHVLHLLISKHPSLGFIRSDFLIGHGAKSSVSRKGRTMSANEQQRIVSNFRHGNLNLLVATNVAEEGLDIKPCNCVIRFDMNDMTLISYIQSRGRARHKTSQFILISKQGDSTAQNLQHSERGISSMLMSQIDDTEIEFDNTVKLSDELKYCVEKTGAIVTVFNAPFVITQYCDNLPRNSYYKPEAEYLIARGKNGCVAEIRMPRNVRQDCKVLRGAFASSEIGAKREVSLRMVRLLHSCGELDDYLRPPKVVSVDKKTGLIQKKKSSHKIGLNKKVRSHDVITPNYFRGTWADGIDINLNVIELKDIESNSDHFTVLNVGFLSFESLEDIATPHSLRIDAKLNQIKVTTLKKLFRLTDKTLVLLRKFHFEFFRAILRSTFDESHDWSTLCVPLIISNFTGSDCIAQDLIDFEALEFCSNVDRSNIDFLSGGTAIFEDIKDFVLFDKTRYSRNYSILELLPNLTPYSEFEHLNTSKYLNVAEVYQKRLKFEGIINSDQFLIRAKPIGYPIHSVKPAVKFEIVMIAPQFATLCPIKLHHLQESLKFPLLIRHINHRLLMCDLLKKKNDMHDCQKLDADLDLIQIACTSPSANMENNYERFETFGDAFLKGNAIQLEGYILSNPLSRQYFIPPANAKAEPQLISDKGVADVVEAIIGACYFTGGQPAASKSVQFFLGGQCKPDWSSYNQTWISYSLPVCEIESILIANCRSVESIVGYRFKDLTILAQALTHPSSIISVGNSYERLEFLGDSILGFIVTQFIFQLSPALAPGPMSDLRSELVHNQFLGSVSCALGLPKLLNHMSADLGKNIATWTKIFLAKLAETDSIIANSKKKLDASVLMFWNQLDTSPKTLGDIYESMLGAVFLDCGLQIEPLEAVLKKTLIDPWWPRFQPLMNGLDGLQVMHPIRILADQIQSIKCSSFVMELELTSNGDSQCTFKLHEKVLATCVAESKRDAKKRAAYTAVKYMNANKSALVELCSCVGQDIANMMRIESDDERDGGEECDKIDIEKFALKTDSKNARVWG